MRMYTLNYTNDIGVELKEYVFAGKFALERLKYLQKRGYKVKTERLPFNIYNFKACVKHYDCVIKKPIDK